MPGVVPVDPISNLPGQSWSAMNANARRAALTRIVVRISREALQGEGLHAMLQGICACIVAELPVAIASVILLNEQNTHFVKEVYAGEVTLSPLAIADNWPVTKGGAGRCARTGRAQLIADVDVDPDYVAGNTYVRSEYLVPIRHGQRMHGVLNIESTRTDFFDAESCAVFDAVSHLVAGAIHFARMADELKLANRKLERISMSDGLTGIANRRCFDERLQSDWTRLAASGEPLALLLVDADAFKPLNDASGHLYGDECLRELARICDGFAESEHDLVARFGGEELVLLLPGRTFAQAQRDRRAPARSGGSRGDAASGFAGGPVRDHQHWRQRHAPGPDAIRRNHWWRWPIARCIRPSCRAATGCRCTQTTPDAKAWLRKATGTGGTVGLSCNGSGEPRHGATAHPSERCHAHDHLDADRATGPGPARHRVGRDATHLARRHPACRRCQGRALRTGTRGGRAVAVAGQSRPAAGHHQPRLAEVRGRRCRQWQAPVFARLRHGVRRMAHHRRGAGDAAQLPGIVALPDAGRAR